MESFEAFPWSPFFSTGLAVIDDQHKELVKIINRLAQHFASGDDPLDTEAIFEQLHNYAHYHFTTEEDLWQLAIGEVPSVSAHKNSHQAFVEELDRLRSERRTLGDEPVMSRILAYLIRWLTLHILKSDRYLADIALHLQQGQSLACAEKTASDRMANNDHGLINIILDSYELQAAHAIRLIQELRARQQYEAQLSSLNQQLERRVIERTRDLELANQSLRSTVAELERTQNELITSEKLASLGAMVAGISHELNTPIGNALTVTSTLEYQVDALTQVLANGRPKKSEVDHVLSSIREIAKISYRCLTQAVHLIQSFKQVAVDRTSEQRRRFAVADVIDDVIVMAMVSSAKPPQSIEVINDVAPQIDCDGYPGPLGQVINNLLQNAFLHAFQGREQGRVRFSAQVDADMIHLRVSDDGVGMSAQTSRRIFEPFFTTRLGQGGSGLGLTVAYRIMSVILGGTLSVESVLHQGTTFVLSFPVTAPINTREARPA